MISKGKLICPLFIVFPRYILHYFSLIFGAHNAISNDIFYKFTLFIAFFVVI